MKQKLLLIMIIKSSFFLHGADAMLELPTLSSIIAGASYYIIEGCEYLVSVGLVRRLGTIIHFYTAEGDKLKTIEMNLSEVTHYNMISMLDSNAPKSKIVDYCVVKTCSGYMPRYCLVCRNKHGHLVKCFPYDKQQRKCIESDNLTFFTELSEEQDQSLYKDIKEIHSVDIAQAQEVTDIVHIVATLRAFDYSAIQVADLSPQPKQEKRVDTYCVVL